MRRLQYVRFRYDAMGDFTRTERQRELLKAVAKNADHHFHHEASGHSEVRQPVYRYQSRC